jgi:4-hydroxyphenylpyruvate dioxygenase-like putative hemolysin
MPAGPQRRDLWDNPMGTDGFEFVEYTGPDPQALAALFDRMGFIAAARHRSKNVTLYKQGEVNFILNAEPGSFAQRPGRRSRRPTARAIGRRPDALAVIGFEILRDLRFVVGALVDRDADPPAWARHRL